jgi:hypothetical protein
VEEKYLRGVLGVDIEESRIPTEFWREKKKTRRRRSERSTTRGTGTPVKKWKD